MDDTCGDEDFVVKLKKVLDLFQERDFVVSEKNFKLPNKIKPYVAIGVSTPSEFSGLYLIKSRGGLFVKPSVYILTYSDNNFGVKNNFMKIIFDASVNDSRLVDLKNELDKYLNPKNVKIMTQIIAVSL